MDRATLETISKLSDDKLSKLMFCETSAYENTLKERDATGSSANDLQDQLNTANSRVEEMTKALKEAETTKANQASAIEGLNAEIAGLRKRVVNLTDELTGMIGWKDTLAGVVGDNALSMKENKASIHELEETVNSMEVEANASNERINNLIETNLQLSDRIDTLIEMVSTMEAHPDVIAAKKNKEKTEIEEELRLAKLMKLKAEDETKRAEEKLRAIEITELEMVVEDIK